MMEDSDDVSVISELPDSGEMSIDTNTNGCTTDIEETTNWEHAAVISVEGENENIMLGEDEYKSIYIHDMFPDLPIDLLGGCSFSIGSYPSEPSPDSTTYSLNVADNKISLSEPVPRPDDGDNESDYDDLAATPIVIVGAFVAPWKPIALSNISLLPDTDLQDPITFDQDTSNGETFTWGYLLNVSSGLDGFPDTRRETGSIRTSVRNERLGSSGYTDIPVDTLFTFRAPSLDRYCPCEGYVLVSEIAKSSLLGLAEGE